MTPDANQDERVKRILEAFRNEEPSFLADPERDVVTFNGRVGVRAQNRTACHLPGKVKTAYYVEGTHYEMGYLLGLLAEPEIERMCDEFNRKVVFEFVNVHFRSRKVEALLGKSLELMLYWLSGNIYPDIPDEYKREMEGILEGCRQANPSTGVSWQELWVLNVGVDALLSFVYTGDLPTERKLPIKVAPEQLAIPLQCNGFSVSGPAAQDDGHFLGRDFMFPTAGVFQDTACMIIQNPHDPQGGKKLPFVSMTAPGMIGCIAGMNHAGLGVGVDMSPAGNCDPSRPGLNSLLLLRHCIENGENCEEALQIMQDVQRGVSWNYILADYGTQRACVVEAGRTVDEGDFAAQVTSQLEARLSDTSVERPPDQLLESLPGRAFLDAQVQPEFRKGLMVRWNDYAYPREYLQFNEKLFALNGKKYDPGAFGERGYISKSWKERNCPRGYYFAPQRESDPNLVLVTNMYVIPEMRLFAMDPWTNVIASDQYDDLQWRYDELNNQLLSRLYPEPHGELTPLSAEDARDLIDFLTPNPEKGKYPDYYRPKPQSRGLWRILDPVLDKILGRERQVPATDDWESIEIKGSVSLMDLKEKTIYSHYGYHGDDWVTIRLREYIQTSP
jgi:hypothetical protein